MTVTCVMCKPVKPPWHRSDSRVLESRKKEQRVTHKGKTVRTTTIVRKRECVKCGWRWKTVEIVLLPIYEKRQGSKRFPKHRNKS